MARHSMVIVGGCGFVGSQLARHMCNAFNVKVLDVNPLPNDLRGKVDFQQGDERDYDGVRKGIQNAELIIHTAIIGIPLINEEKRLGYDVNVLGIQNVCEAVSLNQSAKGLILTGTWHVFGERGFHGVIDEEFGCRPDKVEERARFYALTKTVQENVVRLYDEASDKIYGIIRLGTILGEGMPEKTAANIFISNALAGKAITPYKHSMHRPMLYVDVSDVCIAMEVYARKILNNEIGERRNSLSHIINFAWHKPITIMELANIVKRTVIKFSNGRLVPEIQIIDQGLPSQAGTSEKHSLKLSLEKSRAFLGIDRLTHPKKSVENLVIKRISNTPPARAFARQK